MTRIHLTRDAEFKESEHPRVPKGSEGGGEFTSSGGASPAMAKASKFIVDSHVGLVLKKYGYKKAAPDADGNLVFLGPDNTKVVVHPPASNKKSSSSWTHLVGKQPLTGIGTKLEKVLAKIHSGGVPATPPTAPATPVPEPEPKPGLSHEDEFDEVLRARVKPADQPQRLAVDFYKDGGYHAINDCLRFDEECMDRDTPHLVAWLKNNQLPRDITVWRGVHSAYAEKLMAEVKVGTRLHDKGFMSTSMSSSFARKWGQERAAKNLVLKISAKKGQNAAMISDSGKDDEQEVLFQRNSRLIVKSYDPSTNTVECDLEQ